MTSQPSNTASTVKNLENYVTIEHLSFDRDSRAIFTDINIAIPRGKITAIMGPSGTGKTTLLRLMGGQLQPLQGDVVVAGQKINRLSRKELFTARRQMGLMFQANALFTGMSVYDNVAFPLRVHTDFDAPMIEKLVFMKLEAVGLRGAAQLMPSELSGGMARRVALARAIALDPNLMMYDEPFTGQDPISLGVLVKLIKDLNDSLQMTSVIVTHDVHDVLTIADYVYIIGNANVMGHGTAEEMANSDIAEVKQFMQGLPDGPVPFQYPAQDYAKSLLGTD
jgi:phospholipid/cholesterol/gamma-HCH transport system ATP-binding protein